MIKCQTKIKKRKRRGKRQSSGKQAGSRSYVLIQHWGKGSASKGMETLEVVKLCLWGKRGGETAIKI